MACQFRTTHATTEGTCAETCSRHLWAEGEWGRRQNLTSFIPHNAGCRPELSPSFAAAASVRDVWMIEVSPHKITPTQLLHCHTELSQTADLIQWKAFMCHWARRRNKLKEHRGSRHKYRNKPSCASLSEGSRMLFVISLVLRHSTAPYECIGLHNL